MHLRKRWILILLREMFYMSIRVIKSIVWYKSAISLLIFYLAVEYWSIESGVLKSPTTIFVYFSLQFCQCLLYMFWCSDVGYLYIYNFYILKNWLFYYCIISFLVSCDNFWLCLFFSAINIITPTPFWLTFAWNIFSFSFTFSLCMSLSMSFRYS